MASASRPAAFFADLPFAAHASRAAGESHAGRGELRALGFERVARLCGNVGYIDVRLFPGVERGAAAAATVIDALGDADALIIDLRRNRGGDRATAALLSSLLFDTESILRDAEYWSEGRRSWLRTGHGAPAARFLGREVVVLTGPDTSALGVAFARSLQQLGRASVIGQAPRVPPGLAPLAPDVAVVAPLALHTAHLAMLHRLLASSASDALRAELRRAIRYVQHDLRSYAAADGARDLT